MNIKNLKIFFIMVYVSSMLILPSVVFAVDRPCKPTDGKICNPLQDSGIDSIPAFIQKILQGVIKIAIPILALAIIYSGFLFVAARGNSEKLGKAKDTLLYTLIGAAILLGAVAIAELITNTVTNLG